MYENVEFLTDFVFAASREITGRVSSSCMDIF